MFKNRVLETGEVMQPLRSLGDASEHNVHVMIAGEGIIIDSGRYVIKVSDHPEPGHLTLRIRADGDTTLKHCNVRDRTYDIHLFIDITLPVTLGCVLVIGGRITFRVDKHYPTNPDRLCICLEVPRGLLIQTGQLALPFTYG